MQPYVATLTAMKSSNVFLTLRNEDAMHQVTFEGFCFQYDEALAKNISIIQHSGSAPENDLFLPEPPCTSFMLHNEPADHEHIRRARFHP